MFCKTCNKNLCGTCWDDHPDDHRIIKLNTDMGKNLCSKHNEKLYFYCTTCNKNACLVCDKLDHPGHKLIDISEYYGNMKMDLKTKNEKIHLCLDSLKKSKDNAINNINKASFEFQNNIEDLKTRLDDLNYTYQKTIESKKNKMDKRYDLIVKFLKRISKTITEVKEDDYDCLNWSSEFTVCFGNMEVYKNSNEESMCEIIKNIKEKIKEVGIEINNIPEYMFYKQFFKYAED